jgi:hypothetical protein
MNQEIGFRETLLQIVRELIDRIVELAPRVATAVVVLAVGLVVAKLAQKVLVILLRKANADAAFGRLGAVRAAEHLGIQPPLSESVARLVFYLLLILFGQAAADSLGLTVVGDVIRAFFAFLPSLLAAVLVIVLGNFVARVAGRAAANSSVAFATGLGRLVTFTVMLVVAVMAINQLGIDTTLLGWVVVITLSLMGAAVVLAFGLGTRGIAGNLVAGFYIRKLFRVGDELEVLDLRGTLTGVTPTKALISSGKKTLAVPNRTLLDEVVAQGTE